MIGRPWQKCNTSEIHYDNTHISRNSSGFYLLLGNERYLLLDVIERVGRVDSETDKDYMGIWV